MRFVDINPLLNDNHPFYEPFLLVVTNLNQSLSTHLTFLNHATLPPVSVATADNALAVFTLSQNNQNTSLVTEVTDNFENKTINETLNNNINIESFTEKEINTIENKVKNKIHDTLTEIKKNSIDNSETQNGSVSKPEIEINSKQLQKIINEKDQVIKNKNNISNIVENELKDDITNYLENENNNSFEDNVKIHKKLKNEDNKVLKQLELFDDFSEGNINSVKKNEVEDVSNNNIAIKNVVEQELQKTKYDIDNSNIENNLISKSESEINSRQLHKITNEKNNNINNDVINNKLNNSVINYSEKEIKLKGSLYHLTQIKFSYNSNHIEGSKLTEDETRYIYETNSFIGDKEKIVSIDDINETVNHFKCFDYILENIDILDEKLIKNLHKILKNNTSDSQKEWFKVGDYKLKANFIGNIKTTSPSNVKKEIKKLLEEYNSKIKITFDDIVDFHYKFEAIHPFQDGNGRVGRLIMFKECLRNDIVPFIIDEEHKLFYYRGLKNYKEDKTYLIETCLSAQDRYIKLLDELEINVK